MIELGLIRLYGMFLILMSLWVYIKTYFILEYVDKAPAFVLAALLCLFGVAIVQWANSRLEKWLCGCK